MIGFPEKDDWGGDGEVKKNPCGVILRVDRSDRDGVLVRLDMEYRDSWRARIGSCVSEKRDDPPPSRCAHSNNREASAGLDMEECGPGISSQVSISCGGKAEPCGASWLQMGLNEASQGEENGRRA